MTRHRDAGREYAGSGGEAVQANRRLRTLAILLAASCVLLGVILLRLAGAEPPRPTRSIPTTKYFLHRFVDDLHSRRRATVEEHWTRSLRFL